MLSLHHTFKFKLRLKLFDSVYVCTSCRHICWVRPTVWKWNWSWYLLTSLWRLWQRNEALEQTLVLHRKRIVKSSASVFNHWHCHKDSLCGLMMVTPEAFSFFLDALIAVKNRIIEAVPVSQCWSFSLTSLLLTSETQQKSKSIFSRKKKSFGPANLAHSQWRNVE